jgi:hypothetical protein
MAICWQCSSPLVYVAHGSEEERYVEAFPSPRNSWRGKDGFLPVQWLRQSYLYPSWSSAQPVGWLPASRTMHLPARFRLQAASRQEGQVCYNYRRMRRARKRRKRMTTWKISTTSRTRLLNSQTIDFQRGRGHRGWSRGSPVTNTTRSTAK